MPRPDGTGQCQCGLVRFEIAGLPRDVHYCHCSMCRRAVGNAFATLVWLKRAQVQWSEQPAFYRSSTIARRGFCRQCGTPICLDYDDSDQIALMVGTFDDARLLVPTHHYGAEGRLPWADIGQHLPRRATADDPRPVAAPREE